MRLIRSQESEEDHEATLTAAQERQARTQASETSTQCESQLSTHRARMAATWFLEKDSDESQKYGAANNVVPWVNKETAGFMYSLRIDYAEFASVGGVQQESRSSSSGGLQPWLLGLTAMVVFLFIVFILLIVNRVWCKHKNDIDEEDNKRERFNVNAYENDALDEEALEDKLQVLEGNKKAMGKWEENENYEPKVTAM
ncbi:small integral membrane protein 24 [Rhinoderma darwinii]|uniref:small integral membrane protein 24 n=1 Tax=Rhinoderma darwinii TaxID=43563 RepID=UPI003F66EB21